MTTTIQHNTQSHPLRNPALTGALTDWSLVDVIQLLDLGRKTGAIVVHGHRDADPIEGQITFVEGAIHHARNGKSDGIDAVFELFSATDGTFRFTNLDEVPPRNIYLSNEHVIMEGIVRQDTSRSIPTESDADVFVRLVAVPRQTHAPIVLTEEQWQLITLSQGETSINTRAEHLQSSQNDVPNILHDLVGIRIVEERIRPTTSGRLTNDH